MSKYRLMLCRDTVKADLPGRYSLFVGTIDPISPDRDVKLGGGDPGEWISVGSCRRIDWWGSAEFHRLFTIRLKPGEGPRTVNLVFADKE